MRTLYTFSIYVYGFLVRLAAFRHAKAAAWIHGRRESFGHLERFLKQSNSPIAWFHAASLGEFEQGRPLIEQFKTDHPEYKIVLTFFSPSGYQVRKDYAGAHCVCYLPNDTRKNARRWVQTLQPKMVFFIKYEYWYNYLHQLHQAEIPTYVVSAIFRPSQVFFKFYGAWFRKHLREITYFFVQNPSSLDLLHHIGIENALQSGDTRFDRVAQVVKQKKPIPFIEEFKGEKKLLILGSTWLEDETLWVSIVPQYCDRVKFIFVPHEVHASHINRLERNIPGKSLFYSHLNLELASKMDVLIVDRIGILSHLYQYADVAYIGGGFGKGIHNILEAACFGIPVWFGPNYTKFQEAIDLLAQGGARCIQDKKDPATVLTEFLEDGPAYRRQCDAAKNYVQTNIGASPIILQHIFPS